MTQIQLSQRQRIIIVISAVLLLTMLAMVPWISQQMTNNQIKSEVSKKIGGRQDFNVQGVQASSGDWKLARITSTATNDSGNPALVILHQENGQEVVKFGPGTFFPKGDLQAAGVPQAIQDAIPGNKTPVGADPIIAYLPHETNFYSVRWTSQEYEGPGNVPQQSPPPHKTVLTVVVYELPRDNIYFTPAKKAQYTVEIDDWIRSIGFEPSNYTLFFTTHG